MYTSRIAQPSATIAINVHSKYPNRAPIRVGLRRRVVPDIRRKLPWSRSRGAAPVHAEVAVEVAEQAELLAEHFVGSIGTERARVVRLVPVVPHGREHHDI